MMSAELIGCMNPLRPSSKKKKGGWNLFKAKCGRNWDIFKKPCWREGNVRGGWREQKSCPINPPQPLLWETVCSVDQCNGLCNKTIISHSLSFQSGITSPSVDALSKWMITGEISHPLQTLQQPLLPIKWPCSEPSFGFPCMPCFTVISEWGVWEMLSLLRYDLP